MQHVHAQHPVSGLPRRVPDHTHTRQLREATLLLRVHAEAILERIPDILPADFLEHHGVLKRHDLEQVAQRDIARPIHSVATERAAADQACVHHTLTTLCHTLRPRWEEPVHCLLQRHEQNVGDKICDGRLGSTHTWRSDVPRCQRVRHGLARRLLDAGKKAVEHLGKRWERRVAGSSTVPAHVQCLDRSTPHSAGVRRRKLELELTQIVKVCAAFDEHRITVGLSPVHTVLVGLALVRRDGMPDVVEMVVSAQEQVHTMRLHVWVRHCTKGRSKCDIVWQATVCDGNHQLALFWALTQFARQLMSHSGHVAVLELVGERRNGVEPLPAGQRR